ncbi:nuclear factor related to kappa-B-binding protein [Mixophyes fleayi]|uniref:nuclear factor related to kappa-B-binding protein n=1 Tax=Mixophyes fleayi TaxID=3061075 RepID=UPI003F4E1A5B
MDALDTMLTDPLDLGPCTDSNDTGIMEECLLGGTKVSLPEDLLEDPELFFDVVSMDTWQKVLSDSQREHLRQFLPSFPEDNAGQQEQTVQALFRGDNFRFGNPLHIAQKLFRDGHLNPEVVKYRQLCLKSQYKRYLTSQQQYFHTLLKQILASRKELLDVAGRNGPDLMMKRKPPSLRNSPEERERRAQRRYLKILREVKEECGDGTLSSEEEDFSSWLPGSPTHSPGAGVPLRSIPTLSTQDMKTADKIELTERDLKLLLRKHSEKRKHQPDHPDLMTDGVTMNDIMTRVNAGRKGSLSALYDLATMKKRVKERDDRKRKKLKPIKTEPDDYPVVPEEAEMMPALLPSDAITLTAVKEEPMEDVKPHLPFNEISPCFFSLLLDILVAEGPSSVMLLEDKVSHWQSSPASTLNSWFSADPNWCDLVQSALLYLSGENKDALSGFTPFVEFREKTQEWKCFAPPADCEKELVALFHLWLETKDQIFTKENEESPDTGTPIPRVRTDYIVRPSSGDEKRIFQEQERHRYLQPHKAFTFRMHGFESVVGPVKGVFDKETSLNKAREHSLLRSDRPAYVTILSLVRDAAARLPNGEGTRAEICELLKDSQFLAPDVTSAQVNTVVSGALDRLHYEKDPCVKYDIGRKLWIYLHRDRSEEEFERIHQAQAAAAKAKKALQQKPKTPSKIKSGNKEFPLKSGGTPEPGQLNLNDCSMPLTPGTPSTPTTPALPTTPLSPTISAAVSKIVTSSAPEPPKSSPSVLLVSSPAMPQLSTLLTPSVTTQVTPAPVRTPSLSSATTIPQVRIVTASAAVSSTPPPAIVTQSLSPVLSHIRLPVTATATKGITQVVTMPVKSQPTVGVPRLGTSVTTLGGISVTTLASSTVVSSKPVVSSSAGSAPTILQSITGQSILKQVALSGQLGMKTQSASSLPLSTTNLRIQGKDVLRLPPSSITTDAKGQTILRITPDMMATLAKSQVTAVKLSQELFSTTTASGSGKGLLQMSSSPSSPSPPAPATFKVTPEAKPAETSSSGFRLMPALGVSVADQKGKARTSADTKPATTIRIVQGLGVVPPKVAATQSITVTAKPVPVASSTVVKPVHTATTLSLSSVTSTGMKPVPTAVTMGAATATIRQIPVTTQQQGKLPTRITVPLSVLSQPMKGKSVMTAPIIKGNLGANISGLGRNIILTTVPAGTKLIAGNKPVSFLTAQHLQQLQQQGQATQVRIQTVPASHLQSASSSAVSKAVSTVVVTTTPPAKPPPEPQ